MKKIGFTIGKFAPLHKGHQYLIETALKQMDEFYVVIYDTDVIDIPIETRAKWIEKLYPTVKILSAYNSPKEYGLDKKNIQIQMTYLKEIIAGIHVTHFYSSEEYGKYVAQDLGITEVQVDKKRTQYPIGGTQIRSDLEKQKNYLERIVYEDMIKYNSIV